ncbi:FAD-dependent oxidoreductase [Undibacterium arcticum]|uniref:FAD-dependent oxidoreductase n=1 Tax=Undibacterium arcticum TaxID=1762892 RepID=A0ABV7F0C0_9BURK
MRKQFDVLVIGAGPAGLAAAHSAAASGLQIGIVDDNPLAGGQIWRGGPQHSGDARAASLWSALRRAPNVQFLLQTRVLYPSGPNTLRVETSDSSANLRYERLVLATGARERLLPFPGWTLPGVTGAGGLQALVKGGLPVTGKRVLVAGSGPLLLAVAATLRERGAEVVAIVEQAPLHRLARFALALLATPGKLKQALQLRSQLKGIPYFTNAYVTAAQGDTRLEQAEIALGGKRRLLDCDVLACGYGLLPNLELASALGCTTEHKVAGAGAGAEAEAVIVDRWQQSSQPDIFCAGEGTGIGGVDLALAEGSIAGLAAVGDLSPAARYLAERARGQAFAARLAKTFVLRPELRHLCDAQTIVCRCEDVRHGALARHSSWRSAKLHTRCGMGPCQGRICGGATAVLYGWTQDSVRLPLSPARISSIMECANQPTDAD